MIRFSGCSNRRSMALAIAVACGFFPITADAQTVRTLGTFPWDTAKADVLVQRVSSEKLVVQVRLVTEANFTSGSARVRDRARAIPTEAMEAWVLLDDGTALEQTPRDPPKGAPPVGVGSAGTVYSFVTFGFKSPAIATPVAVVVKVEAHLYMFPWQGGRGSSDPAHGTRPAP
jgi:hypothetical protein